MDMIWSIIGITALAGMGGTGMGGAGFLPVSQGFQQNGQPAALLCCGSDDLGGLF